MLIFWVARLLLAVGLMIYGIVRSLRERNPHKSMEYYMWAMLGFFGVFMSLWIPG